MKRILLPTLMLLVLAGCDSGLRTSYGPSVGILAKRSVNGFTTFRNAFSNAGFATRDLNRLTDRSKRSSVIVWTPGHPTGIEANTTRWLDRWLRMKDKTLIYVVPDSGSETEFYRDARPLAPPQQRLEYRRKYAENLIKEHQWQLLRTALPSNGWLSIQPKVQRTRLVLADTEAARDEAWSGLAESPDPRRVEWVLEAYDRKNKSQQGTVVFQPVGPGSPVWPMGQNVTPTSTTTEFQSIVVSEDGDTLVARITSKAWGDSQVVVVAGGSLLTNYGLTRPENQAIAERLISASFAPLIQSRRVDRRERLFADGAPPQVSFATASYSLPISDRSNEVPRASGAEFFTEFPLSFVTFHIAILGFVICLMLMPIFGRPKRVDRGVLTHFGDHLTAVATLMRRRGGETFARRRISDYMKHVRDETAGPWVIEEPVHAPDPALHLHVPEPIGLGPVGLGPKRMGPNTTAPQPNASPQPIADEPADEPAGAPPGETAKAVDTSPIHPESTDRRQDDSTPPDRG
ncbi:hypothetical protein Enr13x_47390 [Stieleria neptunia]|uniref:DUF4350 domain-containing protein n=1 Tax=Stieleria neptunia TaxID=2527979 RepID=A0A518HVJ5_9BACT|nr:DUF4350 domain-containing protein [Stieleria neptunia]QDV44868.1 hypothetical protein Enr13x_47390 [Stieleria neptunia]